MRLLVSETEHTERSAATYYQWAMPGGAVVESSLLHMHGRGVPYVVCLPSSIGCRMGCAFCAMPRMRAAEPLSISALWDVLMYSLDAAGNPGCFQVSFMGQGEPFDAGSSVKEFCGKVHRSYPNAMIGISTVGVAKGILSLGHLPWAQKVRLQLSVHALPPQKRQRVVRAEGEFPIAVALEAARQFGEQSGQRCCLAYVLIKDVNDAERDAGLLADVAEGGPFYVKVIELNPPPEGAFAPSPAERRERFLDVLASAGVEARYFRSLGRAVGAGCGQTRLGSTSRRSVVRC